MTDSSSSSSSNGGKGTVNEQILRQIEYYFGDSNYPRDGFLQKTAADPVNAAAQDDPIAHGWIPFVTLLTFNRLKALTTDPAVVVAALRPKYPAAPAAPAAAAAAATAAGELPLLIISEDETKIRRGRPLATTLTEEQLAVRVVLVRGFPVDYDLDKVSGAFEGFKVASVRLRRYNGAFKGAAFVEFGSEEEARRYIAEPRTFHGAQLEAKLKKDLGDKDKEQDDEDKKKKGGKGKDDGKKDAKEKKPAKADEEKEGGEEEEAEAEQEEKEIPKDCLVYFENVGEETTREDLKVPFFALFLLALFSSRLNIPPPPHPFVWDS